MLNTTAVGRLGKDPEVRTTKSGQEVTAFSLGVNIYAKGEKQTVWLKCSIWGKRGETFRQYVKKGAQVTIAGSLSQDEWVNKDGETVKDLAVEVQDFTLPARSDAPSEGQSKSNFDF